MNKEVELTMLIADSSIEDHMKSLTVDVVSQGANGGSRVGDSGYMSCAGGQHDTFLPTAAAAPLNTTPAVAGSSHYTACILMPSEYRSSSVVEAQLMPHLLQGMLNLI